MFGSLARILGSTLVSIIVRFATQRRGLDNKG
jgi:hypothetical protein